MYGDTNGTNCISGANVHGVNMVLVIVTLPHSFSWINYKCLNVWGGGGRGAICENFIASQRGGYKRCRAFLPGPPPLYLGLFEN